MIKYIADQTTQKTKNGFFYGEVVDGQGNIVKVKNLSKSYTFYLKTKYEVEKDVQLVVWFIEDLGKVVESGELDIKSATEFSGFKTVIDSASPPNTWYEPVDGQAAFIFQFRNTPGVNPITGEDISKKTDSWNVYDGSKKLIDVNSTTNFKQMKDNYKTDPDTNYGNFWIGPINTVEDYFEQQLLNAKSQYRDYIYGINYTYIQKLDPSITNEFTKEDQKKYSKTYNNLVSKPEYAIEFIQTKQETPVQEKPNPIAESEKKPIETKSPDFPPDKIYTFNVEKTGFLISPELGTFSIVEEKPALDFSYESEDEMIPLDDEYVEEGFFGMSELTEELLIKKDEETSKEIDKNLTEEDKVGSDNVVDGGPTKLGNDADFWALVAICTLEDGDDQARADIAQSIYNRVGSKKYGTSLKAVITAKWQYEPAFKKGSKDGTVAQEWKNIDSKDTALKAIMYSKGWSKDTAISAIKKSFEAIKNSTYQSAAKNFIGGRTDFLSENQGTADVRNKKDPSRKAVMRQSNRANNVFAWNYNYKKNTAYNAPTADWFNKYSNQF